MNHPQPAGDSPTTPSDESETLRGLAHKCRCMARGASTPNVAETLSEMARDYEDKAEKAAARAAPADTAR
jgi:hypothetical protein